jgi:phosphate starvation-inducible protein PhoH and related proteins
LGEKIFVFDTINPIEIYGVNDQKIDLIRKAFPKLKIIARGNTIKVVGNDEELQPFETRLNQIVEQISKYGNISENDILRVLELDTSEINSEAFAGNAQSVSDVIVFGNAGFMIKARTENQRRMVVSYDKNDMVFAIGPAGTGKTYTAVALAVRALKNKEVKRIILTRPAVEAGESLGFLPGDMKEKLDPYLKPLYDALFDMIPSEKLQYYLETGVIEIAPLAFMRGRTLDNAFVILDEAQNATQSQLKMFLTRMGKSAKFYITGDVTQVDLPAKQPSGLPQAIKLLKGINGIDFIFLDEKDVVRHKLVSKIIEAYKDDN